MAGATNPREQPPCTENDHAPQPRRLADSPMTDAVAIRPAVRDEIGAVLDVWRRAEAIPGETDTAADLGRLLRHDDEALLVAIADGQIVGTAIVTWDGWRAGLWRLAVLPELSGVRLDSSSLTTLAGRPIFQFTIKSDLRGIPGATS